MKYRLATKKQLFISRLPANSCPIYRDPPWPSAASRPAVLLHFLLDAFQYQKNETLPRIETALGQCAALPLSGCWPAWTPRCNTGRCCHLAADKNRQWASAARLFHNILVSYRALQGNFWGTTACLSHVSLPCSFLFLIITPILSGTWIALPCADLCCNYTQCCLLGGSKLQLQRGCTEQLLARSRNLGKLSREHN